MDQQAVKREREKRAELKSKYRDAFERISALLFQFDPMGIAFETNTDEYDPEVGTILPRLNSCSSSEEVLDVVCEEFARWFGIEYGDRDRNRALATALWNEWRLLNEPPG